MQRKSLWKLSAALALPVLALAASTNAATLYNSNSFEGLVTGADLNGQGGWIKYGAPQALVPGSATVTAGTGTPAATPTGVTFTSNDPAPGGTTGPNDATIYYHPVTFSNAGAGTDSLVSVQFDLRSQDLATPQSLVGIDVFDINGNAVAGAYFGTQGGISTVNGWAGAGASSIEAQAPSGQYANYQLVMNFLTHTYDIFVNGVQEISNLPFVSGAGIVLSIGAGLFLFGWWGRNWRTVRRARRLVGP